MSPLTLLLLCSASDAISILSSALAKAGIGILYLSTFNTDLILVPEMELQRAKEILSKIVKIEEDV
jgi:hypothetical protein